MFKKSSRKTRRGFNFGVKNYKIGKKETSADVTDSSTSFIRILPNISRKQLYKVAKKCFNFVSLVSFSIFLVPMRMDKTGRLVLLPRSKRLIHYIVVMIFVGSMLQRFCVVSYLVATKEKPDFETFMCSSLFLLTVVGMAFGIVPIFLYMDTIRTYNTWPVILSRVAENDEVITPFDDVSIALKASFTTVLACAIATAVTAISTIFPYLPANVLPMLDAVGLIPAGVPTVVWQLVFLPVEFFLNMVGMASSIYGGLGMQIGIGVHKIFAIRLRMLTGNMTLIERDRTERLFVELQLYNRIFDLWWRGVYPGGLFTMSAGAIVSFYVTIRLTELPWFVYMFFPYTGVACVGFIFWVAYDVVSVQREVDEILGALQSYSAPYFGRMTREERVAVVKRAKALRPLSFNVSNFTEFSLAVPAAAWDEIINQLFFLLTL